MKVLFLDTVHPILAQRFTANGWQCVEGFDLSRSALLESIDSCEGIVLRSRLRIDKELIHRASRLKFIARSGSGLENIDLDAASEKNILVINSPEGNSDAVGEHVIGMLLMLFNNLKRGDTEVREGIWRRAENRGNEIKGKTVGIIGVGHTGSGLAKKLSGFDCTILGYDPYVEVWGDRQAVQSSLSEIQLKADVVSFHVPLNDETHHYLDQEFLATMKNPFYLINTSRGNVVDTQVLIDGLKSKKILGAALDVFEFESRSFENFDTSGKAAFNYLAQCENVILSPHIAGWTHESYFKLSDVLADKVLAHFT